MSDSPSAYDDAITRPAAATLTVGSERTQPFTAAGLLLTNVGGTIAVNVLSTPGMIAMIEHNCTILALENLPAEKATVGFEVCVKHVAAALEGEQCHAHARLLEVLDGRKLRFEVEVRARADEDSPERVIGVGIHERRVIDVSQHAESAGH